MSLMIVVEYVKDKKLRSSKTAKRVVGSCSRKELDRSENLKTAFATIDASPLGNRSVIVARDCNDRAVHLIPA